MDAGGPFTEADAPQDRDHSGGEGGNRRHHGHWATRQVAIQERTADKAEAAADHPSEEVGPVEARGQTGREDQDQQQADEVRAGDDRDDPGPLRRLPAAEVAGTKERGRDK